MCRFLFSILLLLIVFISACEKDDACKDGDGLWLPHLSAERGDKMVHLYWYEPRFYLANIVPPNFEDPDYSKIFMAEGIEGDFELFETQKSKSYELDIENLENNKVYRFYVEIGKKGCETLRSKTIMIMPSKPEKTEVIQSVERKQLGFGDINKDNNIYSYTNFSFEWDGGENCCKSKAVILYSDNNVAVVDTFCYAPSWHPEKNELVYVTDKGNIAVNGHRPSHLVNYSLDEKIYKHYLDGENSNRFPIYSEQGESIIYVSYPRDGNYEIWEMEVETELREKIVPNDPFSNQKLIDPDKPVISTDGAFLYFEAAKSTSHGAPLGIWQFSFGDKTITSVFESDWNDSNPAISPDTKKLAFISNRSGRDEIWMYLLGVERFFQITGSEPFVCRRGLGKIQWKDNSTIIYCSNDYKEEGIIEVVLPN